MSMRRLRAATAAAIGSALLVGAPAIADVRDANQGPRLQPASTFTMAPDGSSGNTTDGAIIPNIDSVKATIRAYYNASSAGIANKTTSPYISELAAIQATSLASLPTVDPTAKKAIIFDADDTTLWTYDMEDNAMHFNFDPVMQANDWVFPMKFPATPGMVDYVSAVEAKGYAVFGITGRRFVQEEATLGNLAKVGYTAFDAENFYTKWDGKDSNKPSYVTCAAACTTVDYKANTRKYLEQDLGYDIVLNIGDQWSDLQGGYADAVLKLPNPTYYLPSPNLPGVDEPELNPRTTFTMAPDGSSGLTEGGEGIPNIDSAKWTIRTYYGATSAGVSNKATSPYLSEIAQIEADWHDRLVNQCQRLARQGEQPALVFDADDTTLWNYDMEDRDMHFNFQPSIQTTWISGHLLPAVPGMVDFVTDLDEAGCTIVGVTGRRDSQRADTIGNLVDVGYTSFTDANYYTKWNSGATPPAYFAGTPCEDGSCTTIEYKSAVRAHVEDQGFAIVANFGDQFSDLIGGHSDFAVKLPNPTYYLP